MWKRRVRIVEIGLIATGSVAATSLFAAQAPPVVIIAIAVVVGVVTAGLACMLLGDFGRKVLGTLRAMRAEDGVQLLHASGETSLEKEIKATLLAMSSQLETCRVDLQRKCKDISSLLEFSNFMTTGPTEGKFLALVVNEITQHLNTCQSALLLLDEETNELVVRAAKSDVDHPVLGERFPATEGIYAQVLQTRRPVILRRGVRERTQLPEGMRAAPADAACIPVQAGNHVLGILSVQGKKDGTGFTQEDSEFLSFLANGTAMVLKQASLQKNLTAAFLGIFRAMVQAVDARDRSTRNHSARVSEYSMALARALKYDPEALDGMLFGSLLHDIGKLGIPDQILNKPGRLTTEEFEIIKSHPLRGVEILAHLKTQLPWDLLPIIESHHERWDGRGYPRRLRGDQIPADARIVALADYFDAITSERIYRSGMPLRAAIMEIRRGVFTHFDPDLVPVATEVLEKEYTRISQSMGLQ